MDTVKLKNKIILFRDLSKEELIEIVENLYKENLKLRDQLSLNSKNSSKPPSTDKNKPDPKSLRKKSNKNPGGQAGHEGSTLQSAEHPDEIVKHVLDNCACCGQDLNGVAPVEQERRQEIDIIPAKKIIREHISYSKTCPSCQHINQAEFPGGIDKHIQYGNLIKAKSVYYNERQLIPYARVKEIFKDEYDVDISTGTLVNFKEVCYKKASFPASVIKRKIIGSELCGFDETGIKINGKLNWIHTASTPELTHFEMHKKRGLEGITSAGIFQNFKGTAIHDHWNAYWENTNCDHGLCNAHHLRELTFAEEKYEQKWSTNMKSFLIRVNNDIKACKEIGEMVLPEKAIKKYERLYSKILRDGIKELPKIEVKASTPRRGRKKKHKIENLHERLRRFKKEVLAFMYDFSIPFTNNTPERDQRMEKVKQKISGGHRSRKGSKISCRLRGYLSTALKNGVRAMDALIGIFEDNPYVPI